MVKHEFYTKLVQAQSEVQLTFIKDRGLIYDRVGIPLAQNRKVASLYTFGKNIDDAASFIKALSLNGISVPKNMQATLETKKSFVWIARHVDITLAKKVKEAVPGVEFCIEDSRFYPEGKVLSGIIGFTGVDNQGLEGIEYYKDSVLKGTAFPVNVMKDSRGKYILFDDGVLKTGADSGVVLTVDSRLQVVSEGILQNDMKEFRAKKAIVLAMDVRTGDIVLAATAVNGQAETKNYATTYLFEPGSIFKTVTFSYLAEKGLYKPEERVNTSKPFMIYGHTIKDVYPYTSLTQAEVFIKSSNIGTVTLTSGINREDFYSFLVRCGFGAKYGIDGVAEEVGLLREPKKWSGLSLASLSIGQEIMVSPMQMVRFYAAVANGGIAVQPRIIDYTFEHGKRQYISVQSQRITSKETADTLMGMLISTVETGTGRRAHTGTVNIGGKTGTAQLIDQVNKTYSKTDYIASFAGIFPAENPKIAMIVIYEAPKSSIYGGATGAETFKKIAEQVAFFYNLGSDNTKVLYAHR
jgi:cell division protein FtsI (penicillin-binding protein 3)